MASAGSPLWSRCNASASRPWSLRKPRNLPRWGPDSRSVSARAQSERWIFPFRGNAGKVRYQRLAVFAQSVEYNVVAVIHEVGEPGREPYNSLPLHEQSRFESSRFIY